MWTWQIDRPDKRKVLIVRLTGNTPTVIAKKVIKESTQFISYKKKTYHIDINKLSFRQKNLFCYLLDPTKGQLHFEQMHKLVAPEMLEAILNRNVVKQLVAGLEAAPLIQNIVIMLLCLGMGIGAGFIIGNYFPIS